MVVRHRAEIDEELRAYVDSTPPPRGLVTVRERLEARVASDTGRHDIEELQRQLSESIRRMTADKLEVWEFRAKEAADRAEKAEKLLEAQSSRKDDRTWQVVFLIITLVAGVVVGAVAGSVGRSAGEPVKIETK